MSKVPLAMIKCTKRHGGWVYRKSGKWRQNYVPDVTLETQGHVGIALGGPFATNTVNCWVENNVHVLNAPSLRKMEYAMITEVDPAATTEPDMTRIGVPMILQSTFPAMMKENGMKTTEEKQQIPLVLMQSKNVLGDFAQDASCLSVYKAPQAPPTAGESGDGQSEGGDSEFGKLRA